MLLRLLRRQISVYKRFFGVRKVCINTSSAVFKYFLGFSGLEEVYLNTSTAPEKYFYIYLSDTSPAPEKHGKYIYAPFRRRRSIYIHLSGAGEAGEVFIYTGLTSSFLIVKVSSPYSVTLYISVL